MPVRATKMSFEMAFSAKTLCKVMVGNENHPQHGVG